MREARRLGMPIIGARRHELRPGRGRLRHPRQRRRDPLVLPDHARDRRRDRGRQAEGRRPRSCAAAEPAAEPQAAAAVEAEAAAEAGRRRPRPRRREAAPPPSPKLPAEAVAAAEQPPRPRRCGRMTDDPAQPRQGAPRPDRRGDDGLQARARGDGRRPRRGAEAAAREGHRQGRQARRAARRPRARSSSRSRERDAARWSRSAARPSRSRTTRSSSSSPSAFSRPSRARRRARVEALEEERVELVAQARREHRRPSARSRFEAGEGESLAAYVHPPANKIGVLVHVRGDDPTVARSSRCTSRSRRPRYVDARRTCPRRRSTPSARSREAADEVLVEARGGAREDRRGPMLAEVVLRRDRARRPGLDPRHRQDASAQALAEAASRCSSSAASLCAE